MSGHERPPLRLIRGGRGGVRIGAVRLAAASPAKPPAVDGLVLEEDTWLILSAGPEVTAPPDHPVRLLTELHEAEPLAPGSVLVHRERPLTIMAVVHDFGADPCCRPEWITAALAGILRICRERRLRSLLLPLFGVRHGKLKPEEIVPLIIRTLGAGAPGHLKSILVAAPPGLEAEVGRLLSRAGEAQEEEHAVPPP